MKFYQINTYDIPFLRKYNCCPISQMLLVQSLRLLYLAQFKYPSNPIILINRGILIDGMISNMFLFLLLYMISNTKMPLWLNSWLQ